MKQKQRVPEGEKYWCIEISMGVIEIVSYIDNYYPCDNKAYESGNYYPDKGDAENAEKKLRAVLNGADVIEMPSEPLGLTEIKNNHLRSFVPERLSLNDLKAFAIGFWDGCSWIASKIVK